MVRPRIEENKGFETPNFKVERMNGWTCPRDVITVVGNEIIEAPTPWRTRNFEVCLIIVSLTDISNQLLSPRLISEMYFRFLD